MEEQKEHFAKLISLELGKPLKNTRDEVSRSIETLAQSAEEANRLIGETIPGNISSRGQRAMAMTFKVPVGVVLAITPFNAPLNLICHKIGPAFAAGNAIILKPAPQTSAVATAFVKLLLEAGFPEKSLQLVIGGVDAGRQLVTDERTNLVSFTGGAVGGEHISNSAGLKRYYWNSEEMERRLFIMMQISSKPHLFVPKRALATLVKAVFLFKEFMFTSKFCRHLLRHLNKSRAACRWRSAV